MHKINLVPMAGRGQRFVDMGYKTKKPLIKVGDESMIIKAVQSMPMADSWIFVCADDYDYGEYLREHCFGDAGPEVKLIVVEQTTEGQACTCLLAKEWLEPDSLLNIGACDYALTYDRQEYDRLVSDAQTDGFIWTFRQNPIVLQDPRMYGWVDVGEQGIARRVSCKIPLSDEPLEDHAIIGAFTFKKSRDFIRCAEDMIKVGRRINGEFYVDEAMNMAIESGLRIKVLEVDHYIGLGTPRDVETYNYFWEFFTRFGL